MECFKRQKWSVLNGKSGDSWGAGQQIRLQGKNLLESEHVKLGAYHTLELDLHRPFTLSKQVWDALDLDRIRQASDPAASADLAVALITVRTPRCLLC